LPADQFAVYGPSHWGALAVFVVGAVTLVRVGRRQTAEHARWLGRILGGVTALIYAAMLVHALVPPTVERSVPLRLTDLATVAAAYALWSQRHWGVRADLLLGAGAQRAGADHTGAAQPRLPALRVSGVLGH